MVPHVKQQHLLAAVAVTASLLFTAVLLQADETRKPKVLLITTETGTEAARHLSWRQTSAALALMNGEQVVWQFNHLRDGSERGTPYFHPLATLDGTVLTDLHPDDHPWHRGLRFAWKKINGLDGYWSWPEGLESLPEDDGSTDVTAVKVAPGKDHSARFELELSYHPPGEPPALTEKRIISVSAPDKNGSYQIDWRSVFTAGPQGAILERTPIPGEPDGKPWGGYAGMHLRVAKRENLTAWALLNSEGIKIASKMDRDAVEQKKSLEQAHGKPARWLALTLDFTSGKRAGVTLFDHPGNLRHPAAWHVSSMPHELIQTPLFHGPYTLEAGKTLKFRFRIQVHSGEADKSLLENQWKDFESSKTE